eukprot:TRINITY_DN337_c0_g1_i1.p1 TRINITY_DN337_c0_g1~~TRINITY_DN337_c0_g1_i1.p1  ORF type:complete len:302 (-),score=34.70 TRINITY_DN337_c0_g1_i1:59-964(-)
MKALNNPKAEIMLSNNKITLHNLDSNLHAFSAGYGREDLNRDLDYVYEKKWTYKVLPTFLLLAHKQNLASLLRKYKGDSFNTQSLILATVRLQLFSPLAIEKGYTVEPFCQDLENQIKLTLNYYSGDRDLFLNDKLVGTMDLIFLSGKPSALRASNDNGETLAYRCKIDERSKLMFDVGVGKLLEGLHAQVGHAFLVLANIYRLIDHHQFGRLKSFSYLDVNFDASLSYEQDLYIGSGIRGNTISFDAIVQSKNILVNGRIGLRRVGFRDIPSAYTHLLYFIFFVFILLSSIWCCAGKYIV